MLFITPGAVVGDVIWVAQIIKKVANFIADILMSENCSYKS